MVKEKKRSNKRIMEERATQRMDICWRAKVSKNVGGSRSILRALRDAVKNILADFFR